MSDTARDLRMAELLAARLCHELVNPIGAISNGVEMLEDEPGFAAEAGKMLGQSALAAARRLQFYRVAYGATTPVPFERARQVTLDLFAEGRVECEWPTTLANLHPDAVKLACNLLLLGAEAIPRGGRVMLTAPEGIILAVYVRGAGARLDSPLPELAEGAGGIADLTPRTVHAAFTGALAARLGGTIRLDQSAPDELLLAALPL